MSNDKTYGGSDFDSDFEVNTEKAENLIDKEKLTNADMEIIIRGIILPFINIINECSLFPYQESLAFAICYHILLNDGKTLSALQARQSGKSHVISCVVLALGVLLPKFATLFKDERFQRFKKGFTVGIFGPDYEKSGIIYGRIRESILNATAAKIFRDPDFNIDIKKVKGLKFPNGFKVDLRTASRGAKIEGATYHLVIIDETQDVDSYIIKKSIMPMLAWDNGNMVMIGTPIPEECYLSEMIVKHQLLDENNKLTKSDTRQHFQFDWKHVAKYNPKYKKFVENMIAMGEENTDEFRMAFNIEWLDSRGRFINADMLSACGIQKKDTLRETIYRGGRSIKTTFTRPHGTVSHDKKAADLVFGIDFGKDNDSTVITIAKVWWENPKLVGDEHRYYTHIYDWFEFLGDDHETQYPQLLEVIRHFRCIRGICDATGVGDPIFSRLKKDLAADGIHVSGMVFTSLSKDNGFKLLQQELRAQRLTFPFSAKVRTYKKHKEFMKQTSQLVKEYKNGKLTVRHPKGNKYHDDYPDSLMMLCWCVNKEGDGRITVSDSPFGSKERYSSGFSRLPKTFKGKSMPKRRFWR